MALPAGRKPRLSARASWRLRLFSHRCPFVGVSFLRFDRNSMFWYSLWLFGFCFSLREFFFPTSQFHPTCLVEGCRLAKGDRIENSKWAVCADRWEGCRSPIKRTGWSGDGRKSRSARLPVCLSACWCPNDNDGLVTREHHLSPVGNRRRRSEY